MTVSYKKGAVFLWHKSAKVHVIFEIVHSQSIFTLLG
ncbi:hypothetical protein P799_17585 [Lysinibacillus sphaericus CBAM5]|uniref:Uncharacterized protein n=1 Tax=Lysinibacillus sphaericus CBAM5 TaxID=1400869 RepID=W7RXE2_LYSSH|nr:hypothetical protein P799_17585 [Lysinibacillus sphaericus CBAM5]